VNVTVQVQYALVLFFLLHNAEESFNHTVAPLVYLSSKEKYNPSDISAQIANTRPQIRRADVTVAFGPLSVDNLDQLNKLGSKEGKDVYLTSTVDVTTNPAWLNGVTPDAEGRTKDATTSCVILTDKGNGTVDVFYMYFFAYNWGGVVINNQLGIALGHLSLAKTVG
jgi:hypothetical protein